MNWITTLLATVRWGLVLGVLVGASPVRAAPSSTSYTVQHRSTLDTGPARLTVVGDPMSRVAYEYRRLTEAQKDPWLAGGGAQIGYLTANYLSVTNNLTTEAGRALHEAIDRDVARIADEDVTRLSRGQKEDVYRLAIALEGLTAARAAGFPVPAPSIQIFGNELWAAFNQKGELIVDSTLWPPGQEGERKMALSARLFRALAEAGPDALPEGGVERLHRLAESVTHMVSLSNDALTLSYAAMGLLAHQEKFVGGKIEARLGRRLVRRLRECKGEQAWGSTWLQAPDVSSRGTASVLEALQLYAPDETDDLVPLVRHHLWGWSAANDLFEMETSVAVLRALTVLPPTPRRAPIEVTLAGKRAALWGKEAPTWKRALAQVQWPLPAGGRKRVLQVASQEPAWVMVTALPLSAMGKEPPETE